MGPLPDLPHHKVQTGERDGFFGRCLLQLLPQSKVCAVDLEPSPGVVVLASFSMVSSAVVAACMVHGRRGAMRYMWLKKSPGARFQIGCWAWLPARCRFGILTHVCEDIGRRARQVAGSSFRFSVGKGEEVFTACAIAAIPETLPSFR